MEDKLVVKQTAVMIVAALALGVVDMLGGLRGVRVLGERFFNPVEAAIEMRKMNVMQSWTRFVGSDSLSSELVEMRQLVRGELQLMAEIESLRGENAALRQLITVTNPESQVVMGRVLSRVDDGVWINLGISQGVERGMAVVADGVLWGQVEQVSDLKSKVTTLDVTGTEWQVSVLGRDGTRVEGIMSARDEVLEVRGLLVSDQVRVGDGVVSLGADNMVGGVPIGRVLSVSITDETSLYQYAQIAWPVDNRAVSWVGVIIR